MSTRLALVLVLALVAVGCGGRRGGDDDGDGDADSDADGDGDGDGDTDADADGDGDADADADGDGDSQLVFVTSTTTTGDLDGAVGADDLCDAAASDAGLGGSFRAWVSTSNEDAIDRVIGVGPWLDVDGATIFGGRTDLAGTPQTGLWLDENGAFVASENVWTGTTFDGTYDELDGACGNWVSGAMEELGAIGQVGRSDGSAWTDFSATTCDQRAHLICFGQ